MLSRVSYRVGNIIRETGQAMDRLGLKVLGSDIYQEQCTILILFLYIHRV